MKAHTEYPIRIVHTCGHTQLLYRSINEPSIRQWVERQEKKMCGNIACQNQEATS